MKYEVTEKEMAAIKHLYELLDIDEDSINNDIEHDYLTIDTGRNGRDVAWYCDENRNKAVYIDNLEELTDEEIESQLC